jgi:two-component system response regulator (stage 0 sporulation protein F)
MPRMLVVDDEAGYCERIKDLFTREGYQVETAQTASSAIEIGKRFLPDLLVVDWKLQDDLDGFDVTRSLRELRPELKTILITAYPTPQLEPKALGARIGAVVYKPFDADELRAAVRRAERT